MTFITVVDKDGMTHWINPKNIEQVSEDPYRDEGSKLYFTSGRCIEFSRTSNEIVDIIIKNMRKDEK